MATVTEKSVLTWQDWNLAEWNRRLFEHFFQASDEDDGAVSRLVVTDGELQGISGERNAPSSEVRKQFCSLLSSTLEERTGRGLIRQAREMEWTKAHDHIPPYFAHLVLTCLAASVRRTISQNARDFRKRLNILLGGNPKDHHYDLSSLVVLWRQLRDWLRLERSSGAAWRELVLPKRDRLTQIGYSVRLAFPPFRDQDRLIDLFVGEDFSLPPPVLPILKLIEGNLKTFSERFQHAFQRFRGAYFQRDPNLYRRPLWAAVRDAVQQGKARSAGEATANLHALLRLQHDRDWRFSLWLQIDAPFDEVPDGLVVEPAGDLTVDGFDHLLQTAEGTPMEQDVGQRLLSGELFRILPRLDAPKLKRAVAEGVLLFVADDTGFRRLSFVVPEEGEVLALVRSKLSDGFAAALRAAGGNPQVARSAYTDWSEVTALKSRDLMHADFSIASFTDVRCLQAVIDVPRLHLRGGVRLPEGWLGLPDCLPEVSMSGVGDNVRVTAQLPSGSNIELIRSRADPSVWQIPPQAEAIDGTVVFQLRQEEGANAVHAALRANFGRHVIGHGFARPRRPADWLGEGGTVDIGSIGEDGRSLSVIDQPEEAGSFRSGSPSPSSGAAVRTSPAPVRALTEILAGMTLERRWVPEGEVLERIATVLGIEEPRLLWDVYRAWTEGGHLDSVTFRRWRLRCCFARRPRLVGWRYREGVRTALLGLAPRAVVRQLELSAEREGARLTWRMPQSPWVPAIPELSADSLAVLERISQDARLECPVWLMPPEQLLISVERMRTEVVSVLQLNHVLYARWNWERDGFERDRQADPNGVDVEWYRREKLPDAFVVRQGTVAWHTRSRTWALLVAAQLRGDQPFERGGDLELRRSGHDGFYLPLPAGRLAAVLGPSPPGPLAVDGKVVGYGYSFSDRAVRDRVLDLLWPGLAPDGLDGLDGRAAWVLALLHRRGEEQPPRLVPVPSRVREVFVRRAAPHFAPLAQARLVPSFVVPYLVALANQIRDLAGD
jgi:hypothetical protein